MIEACVLLALAGQHDKCKLITEGADVYRDMAATIYEFDRDAFMAIPEEDLSPDETEQRRTGNGTMASDRAVWGTTDGKCGLGARPRAARLFCI
jgi:hypothetical protein